MKVQWYHEGEELLEDTNIKIEKSTSHSRLVLTKCRRKTSGEIKIKIKNECGITEAITHLVILGLCVTCKHLCAFEMLHFSEMNPVYAAFLHSAVIPQINPHNPLVQWKSLKVPQVASTSSGGPPKMTEAPRSQTTSWSASKLAETAGRNWGRLAQSLSTGIRMWITAESTATTSVRKRIKAPVK